MSALATPPRPWTGTQTGSAHGIVPALTTSRMQGLLLCNVSITANPSVKSVGFSVNDLANGTVFDKVTTAGFALPSTGSQLHQVYIPLITTPLSYRFASSASAWSLCLHNSSPLSMTIHVDAIQPSDCNARQDSIEIEATTSACIVLHCNTNSSGSVVLHSSSASQRMTVALWT
eukprot:TRINITY_DN11719_c0_g3_i1.p1 TRINITY_DN11719_c0_g3~~TRINITY_DN11719_c0_g3_i1.p1  ORF type:complete len:174 (+),score=29.89 TRINITY_DN11719_c0_g3_i1:753-1274(+)